MFWTRKMTAASGSGKSTSNPTSRAGDHPVHAFSQPSRSGPPVLRAGATRGRDLGSLEVDAARNADLTTTNRTRH